MSYRTISEKEGRLAHLRKEAQKIVSTYPRVEDIPLDEAKSLVEWNTEMNELGEQIKQLIQLDDIRKSIGSSAAQFIVPNGDGSTTPEAKAQDAILDNEGFKAFVGRGGQGTFSLELNPESKTLVTLTNGGTPQNARLPRVEPLPVERRTVADLMMQGTIDRGTLEYYEETTLTNAAVEVAEGAAKPEAALAWTLRTESLSKIAVWIPATTESLSDISWLRSMIENRLVYMVERRKEAQLMNGDGTAPNISGITDRVGIQTQAKGADPVFDAILKAMTLIQVNSFYEPDAIVMHPNDWRDLVLTRTADGLYILGNPNEATAQNRLWGLEVRVTTAQTENTAVVGAFGTAAQVFYRGGITVTASTEHSTFFTDNKVAILAEQRLGLAVYRPNAFATVTGI